MSSTLTPAAPDGSTVTYEQLHEIQEEFEDSEVELVRQHVQITRPILEKRAKAIAAIPNFWPLVFEQAPQDIDEYIQPTDANVLMSSLKSISVSHFEIDNEVEGGDPRSISIKWEFGENDYFEDRFLEKKFWYRRSKDSSWSGLVSEPVDIKWKSGKDLTHGLLAMVRQVWDEEQNQGTSAKIDKPKGMTPSQEALKKKIESAGGVGGVSFFAWFGYRGRHVTAEENRQSQEERRLKMQGKRPEATATEDKDDDMDEDYEDDQDALEAFPGGDELAVCIADDLWQDAIKYFMQAQEDDGNDSGDDFESDEDEEGENSPAQTPGQPPAKKQKK
ncbi:hypothetical protein PspLS_06644 [Pyricularia sp. CBS 133598]|nr:hypothetical protein PspLS_06644 [Pyricularia sp. CBS 133598]